MWDVETSDKKIITINTQTATSEQLILIYFKYILYGYKIKIRKLLIYHYEHYSSGREVADDWKSGEEAQDPGVA